MDQQDPLPPPPHEQDALARAAQRTIDALRITEEEEKRPVIGNLRLIGSMGWSILLPTFVGLWLGHWLDHRAGTGMIFHVLLMVLGLFTGFAWMVVRLDRMARAEGRRIRSQHSHPDHNITSGLPEKHL